VSELTAEPAEVADITQTEAEQTAPAGSLVEDDLLVEDVSIDGMCGVY
jgi:mycofactocin precursor